MLAVYGTIALDTIQTPTRTRANVLGGSASYAAVSASYFTKTGLVSLVGSNFPIKYKNALARHVDLRGLDIKDGKTFQYNARYASHLESRKALKIDFGVTKNHHATVPDAYKKCRFVYLSNNNPIQNVKILKSFDNPKFSMCDTIDLWIDTQRDAVIRMIKNTDATVINYEEARLLTKEYDASLCAKKIASWGAKYVIIKKDEHGALLYSGRDVYPYPAFPIKRFVDPTGAGDSFAGAIMGYLESKGSYSIQNMRRAVAYGIVMGAMAVEKHGINPLLDQSRKEIDARMREYERITQF